MELNSRELALMLWIGIAMVSLLLSSNLRPALFAVTRAMLHPKILYVVGLGFLYSVGCVWILARIGLWQRDNLKTTILWYVTTAIVAMASTRQLEKGVSALWALVREATTIAAIVLFIGSVNTLPFWAEFLLVPIFTFLTAMVSVGERQPEHKKVVVLLNGILIVAGLSIIGYSINGIITDWQHFDTAFQVREFVIPVALTLLFLPYLYGEILFIGFETAAIRLKFSVKDPALRRYVWVRGMLAFGANSTKFLRFVHSIQMANVSSRDDVKSILSTLRRSIQREKSPPAVDWAEGWSPYSAILFLAEHGLQAGNYHPTSIDWSADSPYVKVSDGVLPDRLSYQISGTETAATELQLELSVRSSNNGDPADDAFWTAALTLVRRSLGDDAADRFNQSIPSNEDVSAKVGMADLMVSRDEWKTPKDAGYGRKLTIRHPAHRDPFAELG